MLAFSDLDPPDRSEEKVDSTLRIVLCLIIAVLIALAVAQFAFIIARENRIPITGALAWSGGSFMATAMFVTTIMSVTGVFI
ncbi:hypothetical protein ACIBO5_18210 [Nonomuraea angiospora]|uniref:hypothetical protein n=1 Tax=Nonomuraea angiospora TaxID=46172 RepID=UPI00378A4F86